MYYDAETGFYYVSSRYYDPEIGRWINADGQIANIGGDVLGYDMFAYCMNNPVNMDDPTGNWPKWISKVAKVAQAVVVAVAVTVAIAATAGVAAFALGASATVVTGVFTGALAGGAMTSTVNIATQLIVHKGIQAGANMLISQSAYIMQTCTSGSHMNLYGFAVSTVSGFISGATFNAPAHQAFAISLGLEIAGNGEELINIYRESLCNR